MKQIHGHVGSTLWVREDVLVVGTLRAGAVVADGCTLMVHGDVLGTLEIGRVSRAILGGTLGAFVDHNAGTLSVAGAVATPVETIAGTVVVAANTAVTVGGRTVLLTADGMLSQVQDVVDISLSRADAFRWEVGSASFTPCSTADFTSLAECRWPPPRDGGPPDADGRQRRR